MAILNAFTALLAKKSYSRISVQEIIDGANVGRTTFYAHFETKDFLLKELCEELFRHIIESAVSHGDAHCHYIDGKVPDSVFLHLIQHLQKNDRQILELLSSENNGIFLRYFKENLKMLVLSQYDVASSLPQDYAVNHIAAAFVETVDWWLSRGMKESAEQITAYFQTAVAPFMLTAADTE